MTRNHTLSTLAAIAGVCLVSLAGPVSAQSASASDVAVKVRSADLDLSHADGAKVMLQRIHNAAAQICGPMPSDWLAYGRPYNACVKATVDTAVARLGSPTVTAMNTGAPASIRVAQASTR